MSTVAEIEAARTLTFHQALVQAEAQARSTLDVALHERLSAAVALVKDGRVFQTSAGTWQVDSTSTAGLTYTVNGTCNCDDHRFNNPPRGLCKHRLGMFLSQRVLTLMRQPTTAPVGPAMVEPWPDHVQGPAPQSTDGETDCAPAVSPVADAQAPTGALPEAPASVNVRLLIDGRDCQLTLRDTDETRLLVRLQAVLAQHPATPAAAQGPPSPAPDGWCQQHNTGLKLNHGKDGRTWKSHRLDDGTWCKGR